MDQDANKLGSPEREPGCLFCDELLNQAEGVIADTGLWRVLVSRDQGYLGRCMVIASRHVGREAGLSEEEVLDFHYIKVALEEASFRAFGASLGNWTELGNDAFQDEVPKPHLHHHFRPRYPQSVIFAGKEFEDARWGHMYDLDQRLNVDKNPDYAGFKELVAAAYRENIPIDLMYR